MAKREFYVLIEKGEDGYLSRNLHFKRGDFLCYLSI